MAKYDDDLTSRLRHLEQRDRADILASARRGTAVQFVVNAPLAIDVAKWQAARGGWRFLMQTPLLVTLVFLFAAFVRLWGGLVAIVTLATMLTTLALSAHWLAGRAQRCIIANRALLDDE